MRTLALLVKRDLRKRTGQLITVFVLTLLASALLHTAVMLVVDYRGSIEAKAQQWNSPAVMYIVDRGSHADRLIEQAAASSAVDAVELTPSFSGTASFDVADGSLTTLVNVIDVDAAVALGTARLSEVRDLANPRGIIAPVTLRASGAYVVGDAIVFDTAQGEARFVVEGFMEDFYGGSPGMGLLGFGVSGEHFERFDEPAFVNTANAKAQGADVTAVSRAVYDALDEVQMDLPAGETFFSYWGSDLAMTTAAALMTVDIVVLLLTALAVIILAVTAIVTRFVLQNLITGDMTSIGTLRAAGHTTGGIIAALVATYLAVSLAASALGSAASYLLLPVLAEGFQAQNGLSWSPAFSAAALVVTVAAMTVAVGATAAAAARRVRRVTTVAALRGGVATHSSTTTRLPLDTARGRLTALLGIKSSLRQAVHIALMALTVAVVAFAAMFSLGMVETLIGDRASAVEMIVGKVEDVSVEPAHGSDADELLAEIQRLPGVETAFFQNHYGMNVDGLSVGFSITPEPASNDFDPIFEGRAPEHDNEVAIGGRLASIEGLELGSTYTIDVGQGPADYLVVGITSSVRNFGQSVVISSDGYRRIQPLYQESTIAVLTETPDATITAIKDAVGPHLIAVHNQRENVEASLSSYLSVVPVIGAVVAIIVVLVTVLVVGLVVTTMLVNTRRELGVKKAMGFTNAQLAAETRWTYLPAIVVGAVVGVLVGAATLGPILTSLLRGIGIMRIDVVTNWLGIAGTAAGIVIVGLLAIQLSALRISRISAYRLVTA